MKTKRIGFRSPALNLGNVSVKEADELITGEQELTIGSFTFQIYETPGHSPGSISLYFKDDGIVCSGDVLFKGSIGRSDLPNCNPEHLMKSIHDKLLPYRKIQLYFAVMDLSQRLEMK